MEQSSRQRIDALDALRGIAILGILLLNISGFALLRVASFNPMHSGEATFADKLTWMGLNLFTQGKFLFIFALLFGGTLYLLSQRSVAWNVSRLIILALIGIIHTLLLWEGDILFPYSICGLFVLFFIKALPIKRQFIFGLLLYLFGAIILAFLFYYYRDFVEIVWYSSDYSAMIETNWKTGNYINSIYWRLDELSDFIFNLVRQYSWFLIGAMLMGAALMASGWLQRRYSQSHYGLIAVCFLVISLLFQGTLVITDYYLDWHYMWSAVVAQPITMVIQIIQSLGYIALLYWAWPYIQHSFIAYALRCVGKMALTTYLLQSIIGTTLFQRMGLFNQFTLLQLMLFVMAIWVINIIFAVTWLRYFSQGPIEWLWRHSSTGLAKRF
ncbi:DUF418 domain-containing protein [Proteus mirabilis]|uniref:DUF418 domain-containing protein YeiB n=1 Tax=Proteus mirabilis TaxID=584 RepID=UPI001A21735E|nr:DUF418 domain-containing protein YeiB [Proteus mirabilis]MBI6232003.1 DUF418 domain-containing protein [Proteus mirabilis]MDC9768593.1 DUF418 domain-containing protein YeiB [Proteus mirabilis]HCT9107846.1 DUF418 domain-containing protein [Proteus mirabilis]